MLKKVALLIILGIIIISNFIPKVEIGKPYCFQSADGDFKYYIRQGKSGNVSILEKQFREYLAKKNLNEKNEKVKDEQIYRTFKKEIYKFWRWREYLVLPRYKYPYKEFIEE